MKETALWKSWRNKMSVRKHVALHLIFLLLAALLTGCAHQHAVSPERVEDKAERFDQITKSKALRVTSGHYLGAKSVELRSMSSPVLQTPVTLRTKGTLGELVEVVQGLVPVTVNLAEDTERKEQTSGKNPPHAPVVPSGNASDDDMIGALLSSPLPGLDSSVGKRLSVNYEGPLKGLLSQISAQSGYGWDYDKTTNTVTFAKMMVRTFTLIAAPGEVSFDDQLTNKSKENTGIGTIGGSSSNINTTVQNEDSSTQTNQTTKSKIKFDIWKDTEQVIKSMLSAEGKAVANQAAGTITVKDRPENIRQISSFIEETNARYSKQVSVRVNVYSLEVTDDAEAGIDLQALFSNENIAVTAGSLATAPGSLNTAAATVVTGKLKDSTAVIRALKQWGNATEVTSGGAVAMNNQLAPILNTTKHAYLAGSSTQTTDYGQTTELTPGEVTTGFAMRVVPHIVGDRRVVLQYTLNLSSLDDMQRITSGGTEIQLPQVSTRAFSQRVTMQMGQTIVLAGFAQSTQTDSKSAGAFSLGKQVKYARTLLIITIEVENASPELGVEG